MISNFLVSYSTNIIMKWASHTESIANTISKYTGVINRLKHTLPTLTHTAYIIQYINTTTLILRFTTMGT